MKSKLTIQAERIDILTEIKEKLSQGVNYVSVRLDINNKYLCRILLEDISRRLEEESKTLLQYVEEYNKGLNND